MNSQIILGTILVFLGAIMMITITISIAFLALFIWGTIFFLTGLFLLIFKDKESEIEQIKSHKGGKKK
jgi:hypothetical protein